MLSAVNILVSEIGGLCNAAAAKQSLDGGVVLQKFGSCENICRMYAMESANP